MLAKIVAICLIAACSAAPMSFDMRAEMPAFEQAWAQFKLQHSKIYHSIEEEYRHQQTFFENLKTIEAHNYLFDQGLKSYKKGINQFSDMTDAEFNAFVGDFNMYNVSMDGMKRFRQSGLKAPESVDWRTQGLVTEVKNQAHCGSCWAFSATGAIEGQWAKSTGTLVSLSEQNLVDCTGPRNCHGYHTYLAFQYVIDRHGIDTEEAYPYQAEASDSCHFHKHNVGAKISSYASVSEGDENALMEAVATIGPISVSINSHPLHHYAGGILDDPSCSQHLHHAVLVVGYGSENGQDYWIVKNSWGDSWGESGYVRMSRNKDNQCGIATRPFYPIV